MKIAIVDNNIIDLETTNQLLLNFTKKYNYEIEVFKYNLPSDFIESKVDVDLIFLESKFEIDRDGIELGELIKKNRIKTKMIYLTHSKDNVRLGYKVQAVRYLIKPITQLEFNREVFEVINEYGLVGKIITDYRLKKKIINVSSILYIESMGRKTLIYFSNRGYDECTIPMYDWENILKEEEFIKVHRSYLVNINGIIKIVNDKVLLSNGCSVPIARNSKKKLRERIE